ncbi:MAG: LPS assembly lipoprotein LptE [Lacipirellulaceae bacterium]
MSSLAPHRRRYANRSRFPLAWIALAIGCALLPGCAAYRVGAETLYDPDVQTVYVPMIASGSFRRDLGERLTEAIIKEIELKTPFKVVNNPNADSVLDIRLHGDARRTLAEDQFDNPRLFENQLVAQVEWSNRRREPLTRMQTFTLPGALADPSLPPGVADPVGIGQATPLIGEAGQTLVSQQQLAIARLAEQIVATMETPW